MKNKLFNLFIILVAGFFAIYLIYSFNFVYAITDMNKTSNLTNTNPKVSTNVLKSLENETKVEVAVILKDSSNISYDLNSPLTVKSRRPIFEQKKSYYLSKEEDILSTLNSSDFELTYKFSSINAFVGFITKSGLEKLKDNPEVLLIEGDKQLTVGLQDSVPLLGANRTWNQNYSGNGVTVCVIDTGINWSHSDLGGCFGGGCKVIGGHNYYNNSNYSKDKHGHGTAVAGIVAANGKIKGVAPNASLISMRVCSDDGINCSGLAMSKGIDWCISNASVLNISIITLSIYDNTTENQDDCYGNATIDQNENLTTISIYTAYVNGIFVDTISGNDGFTHGISWPGCVPGAVSVGATDKYDNIWRNTSRWNNLDLLAPGIEINSTSLNGSYSNSTFGTGTSVAAPHVAGAAALLLEKNSSLTPDDLLDVLITTAKNIFDSKLNANGTANGNGTGLTFKRINVTGAINKICGCSAWVYTGCGGGICQSSEGRYIRNCTGLSCEADAGETCIPAASCVTGSGGTIRNVCKSGCSYPTIQAALNAVTGSDLINITDNATYQENIVWPQIPAGGITLDCRGATINSTIIGSGNGIYINDSDDNTIRYCNIKGFAKGIRINSTSGENKIKYNNITGNIYGILFEDSVQLSNYILYNNISNNSLAGIYFLGSGTSSDSRSNIIQNNIIWGNKDYGVRLLYGASNVIRYNSISNQTYGIHLFHGGFNGFADISNNLIYGNSYGIKFQESWTNTVFNGTFCPSSVNDDFTIQSSDSNTGDLNRCEKPGIWNDTSVASGCRYLCNSLPNVSLLTPANGTVSSEVNITFICTAYDPDDYNLSNITLYHNIGGTWQANQTQNISGITDSATFTISNIPNGTYQWNCKVSDQDYYNSTPKSDWGDYNYTFNITTVPPSSGNESLNVSNLTELNSDGLNKTFEFRIKNTFGGDVNNINWSFNAGAGQTIYARNLINLSAYEEAFVYVQYNYSSVGDYTVNATAFSGLDIDSRILNVSFNIKVQNLSVLNSSAKIRTFEFLIKNPLAVNLNKVYWNLTFGDGKSVNATQIMSFEQNEQAFVIVEYNYTTSSPTGVGYIVNASAYNSTINTTIISSQNITITVT